MTTVELANTIANVSESVTLRGNVLEAINRYFATQKGREPADVNNKVLKIVEGALYEAVMRYTRGNQSRAARLLGVSRGTLRTKLKEYFGTTHVGLFGYEELL